MRKLASFPKRSMRERKKIDIQDSPKILIGFSIFLEHILHYEERGEKERMSVPPLVQLGGGAWNIAKTLEALGVGGSEILLFGMGSRKNTADHAAISFLLGQEKILVRLLPLKERAHSSYYMIPRRGDTWAFGDTGGKLSLLSRRLYAELRRLIRNVPIRILAEVSSAPEELRLAKCFLQKDSPDQISILTPSLELVRSGKMATLLSYLDCLIMNEVEAAAFFHKRTLLPSDLLRIPVDFLLVTRGAKEAWLKAKNNIYRHTPKKISNPRFLGGAGDAATAAFLFKRLLQGASPQQSLDFALEIGRQTLLLPTSYWHKR